MNINIRHIVYQMRNILAVAVGLFALSAVTPQAFADGTETLGVPSIVIANGTDVIISGTGLSLAQPDVITINVPVGSTVQQVLLYWEGRDFNPLVGDSTVLANGIPVVGTLIGGPILWSTPSGGTSFGSSYTYRADITGLGLIANGPSVNNISIGGLSFNYVSNGAGITVVVDDGSASSSIEIRDGNDLANDGIFKLLGPLTVNTVPQTFNFAATGAERMGTLSMHVSAVQGTASSAGVPRSSAIDVESGGVTTTHNNILDSHNGEEWDAVTVPVTIPAGAASVTVEIFSEDRLNTGDNPASLTWNAAALSIPTPPPPLARLGDRVWEDEDVDGIQDCVDTNGNGIIGDSGDPLAVPPIPADEGDECGNGIPDLLVEALTPGGDGVCNTGDESMLFQDWTDQEGFYGFADLTPGTYCVQFHLPADDFCPPGYGNPQWTLPNVGFDDLIDSDADPSTGQTGDIPLGAGDIDLSNDAGVFCPEPPPPPQCDLILDKTCLVSEAPPRDFVCTKPIDELSMVWNGADNVRIEAYKGDTGAALLANISNIGNGDTVTVQGFAGSPNDVTWVIFDSMDVKIGESVFHMSCSDADMNGLEDCGKPAGDGKSGGGMGGMGGMGGDTTTDRINDWLFEGMVDAGGTLSCSAPAGGGNPGGPFPTDQSCSFTGASADVTYGYTVTNLGDPMTNVVVSDDLLGPIGGPIVLDTGDSAQFTASATIVATTTNVASATGDLSDGASCPAEDSSLIVEKITPPGSCDDGKATELVFAYTGDACSATTQYQLDNKGKAKFTCDPTPGVPLGGLNGITIDKDAGKVSAQIIGNTVRIFRSDTLGAKLAADTRYTLLGDNDDQSQNLHTSCSKPLAVGDQFGALYLMQIVNEY